MSHDAPAYGLWILVVLNSAVFIFFAFSFFKPKTSRDWRSFGAFSAFLVALFAEMYGFPLTIYLLSGWLQSRYPNVDWFSHDAGHLLEMLFGWRVNPHAGPFHILSFVLIGGGFLGFLFQWPTLLTLLMFPVLVGMYVHLAHVEEAEERRVFGAEYDQYAAMVPAWFPRFGTNAGRRPRIR